MPFSKGKGGLLKKYEPIKGGLSRRPSPFESATGPMAMATIFFDAEPLYTQHIRGGLARCRLYLSLVIIDLRDE